MDNVLISQIYDESTKEYPAMVEGYHYLNNYNYFMGMRVTHNRALLKDNPDSDYIDIIPYIRKKNYNGDTDRNYEEIQKTPFGEDNLEYSSGGGFGGSGGFIHYFGSDLTIQEADQQFL